MFTGCFTKFTGDWFSEHRVAEFQRWVEDWLLDESRKAFADIPAESTIIWLYWPYSDPAHAGALELQLDSLRDRLMMIPVVSRRARHYFKNPVQRVNEPKSQFVSLFVGLK